MRLRTAVPMTLLLLLLLCACGAAKESAQTPIRFRTGLMEAGACGFSLSLRADYGDYVRDFKLNCESTPGGKTMLTVVEPEIAGGITASVEGGDAHVSYDDTILAVEAFSSRPISPMAAPYLLTSAWSEGYIDSVGMDGENEEVHYLLGYGGKELEIITWFSGELPLRAEITDGTNTLISCEISNFTKEGGTNEQAAETDLGGDRSGSPGT